MKTAFLIKNGIVENVILLGDHYAAGSTLPDGSPNHEHFPAPDGVVLIVLDDGQAAGIGWSYSNGVFTAPPYTYTPTLAEQWVRFIAGVKAALDDTDMVTWRCYKAGVAFPAVWLDYTRQLRALMGVEQTSAPPALPVPPAYPEGT
jgi:hypothetical protein